jgi:tRNA(Ser,Leu) C12 N-acetylase TAN1
MGAGKVQSLVTEIEALSEAERQELAHEVLPLLLTTRAGLEEIDRSIEALSDEELDAIIERARQRAGALGDEAVAAIISEAVRAVRTQGGS